LSDAITEDLTTDLCRVSELFVISRSTAFTYKDTRINVRQIGRELNVQYVLEGSVRSAGNRFRVNAQLIDAETDRHIWADRFDYTNENHFMLQDDITSRIAASLHLELIAAEAARPTDNPDALDCILRGRAALYPVGGRTTADQFAKGIELLEKALALDTGSIDARALLAETLIARVFEQATSSAETDLERAEGLADEVLTASPGHAVGHFARAQILRSRSQYEAAIPEYETAIAANRNWVAAIAALGLCKFFAGDIEAAIPAQELAIRLSPRDPRLPNWYWRIGMVHLLQSRIDEAILWIEKARTAN